MRPRTRSPEVNVIRGLLLFVCTVVVLAGSSDIARAQSAEELKAEIKARCEKQMGQYGRALVLSCMNQDKEAVTKIAKYQESHPEITARCLSQMREYGFALVASCIEQDLASQREIDDW